MSRPDLTALVPTDVPPTIARAVLLVLAAHDGRDRGVWGGDRAITYWDRLPDRVRTSCYRGPTLGHWWEAITRTLGTTQPGRAADRDAIATALTAGDDIAVLDALRTRTEMVCLHARIAITATYTKDTQ